MAPAVAAAAATAAAVATDAAAVAAALPVTYFQGQCCRSKSTQVCWKGCGQVQLDMSAVQVQMQKWLMALIIRSLGYSAGSENKDEHRRGR
eukprot:491243-Pelagomonas_calceolata.AAC.3